MNIPSTPHTTSARFRELAVASTLLGSLVIGTVLCAPPLPAQNPLGRKQARAEHAFAGTFTGEDVSLDLTWNNQKSSYTGKLTVDGDTMAVEATENGGTLSGSFTADGETYRFTLTARDGKFVLRSDDEEHLLERQGGAPAPVPAPAPAPATNHTPGGVGIAFQPRDGKLVVAQLAPDGPAAKAKVPVGAILRAVDGKQVDAMPLEQVRSLITGEVGSMVTLTLETDTEVLDVLLQRATLNQPGAPGAAPNDTPGNPGAARGNLPPWMKAGMRATYFSGSASIPGVGTTFVEDDDGTWTDGAGKKFRPEAMQGTGGAGFTQYDFVQVAPEAILLCSTNFVYADAQLATVTRTGVTGFAGDQNGLGDLWMPPAKLRAMQEEQSPGHRVHRIEYPLDGRTYHALTMQMTDQNGYTRYTYDLETGLMIAHSHSSVGKAVLTPNANGTSTYGDGVTTIVHGHLRGLRELRLPWLGQKAPQWLQQGQSLRFSGTMKNSLAEGVMAPWFYGFSVGIDRRVGDGALATLTTRLDYGHGQPPQDNQSQLAYGPGSPTNLWITPSSVQNLQPGQVLDRDPITNCQISFVGSDGNTATICEQGALESQTYTYELRGGQLVATSVRQKQGPALLSIDVQVQR